VDIGVSYGLAGVAGVLTYRLPRRLRWPYAVALVGLFGYLLVDNDTFTDLGHFTAVLIGLCCYALTPLPPTPAPPRDPDTNTDTDPDNAPGVTKRRRP
jgi:hypothetical protein